MAKILSGAEVQGADRSPRTVSISLRPQDAALLDGYRLDQTISIALQGIITSLSQSEYGCNLSIEIDSAGIAIQKPEPKKFIEQVDSLKILKG